MLSYKRDIIFNIIKIMNKKQRNRKLIKQNKRNKMVNRRYSSTLKTFSKLFKANYENYCKEENSELKNNLKLKTIKITNILYSIFDKSVKKNVIHKNTAARKKSRVAKLLNNL